MHGFGSSIQPTFMPTLGHTSHDGGSAPRPAIRQMAKLIKGSKGKGGSGRTYTSRYRGVHQTFPTRRWEAQFRRNGKPTSLGCFDHEEEAAKAYDKMMLWCELHNAGGVKGGVTNFDPSEYEEDIKLLQQITQDDLVALLRSDGRRQAAQRNQKVKRNANTGPPAVQQYTAEQQQYGEATWRAAQQQAMQAFNSPPIAQAGIVTAPNTALGPSPPGVENANNDAAAAAVPVLNTTGQPPELTEVLANLQREVSQQQQQVEAVAGGAQGGDVEMQQAVAVDVKQEEIAVPDAMNQEPAV